MSKPNSVLKIAVATSIIEVLGLKEHFMQKNVLNPPRVITMEQAVAEGYNLIDELKDEENSPLQFTKSSKKLLNDANFDQKKLKTPITSMKKFHKKIR